MPHKFQMPQVYIEGVVQSLLIQGNPENGLSSFGHLSIFRVRIIRQLSDATVLLSKDHLACS